MGLTYSAYPRLKIVHRAGQVHSNVDPLSRLQRRIPSFEQPASNDPDIDLSQEKELNFYGRMKQKFHPITIEIDLPNEHRWNPFPISPPLEWKCFSTPTLRMSKLF